MEKKLLTAKELRDTGILSEINRLVLHPRGYCVELQWNFKGGDDMEKDPARVFFVDDCHTDPKNSRYFAEDTIEDVREKAKRYWESRQEVLNDRRECIGSDVQEYEDDPITWPCES